MKEKWMRWEPLPNLRGDYYLEHAHNNTRGLEILLFDPNHTDKRVRIFSTHVILAYTVYHLPEGYTRPSAALQGGIFFEIEDSRYVDQLMVESGGLLQGCSPRHFAIITANAIVDIVDPRDPEGSYIMMDLTTKTLLYKEIAIPYILSNAPTARIILYEPEEKEDANSRLYLAIDCDSVVDQTLLKKIENDLQTSDVPLPCEIVDCQKLSELEQNVVENNCIVWRE